MRNASYIAGWVGALVKYALAQHDIEYMRKQHGSLTKDPAAADNVSRVWGLFNTTEAPGSTAGFGEESSSGTP